MEMEKAQAVENVYSDYLQKLYISDVRSQSEQTVGKSLLVSPYKLQTFKESQKKKLEIANDIIVKASQDAGGSFHIKVRQERDFYNYPLRSS